MARVMQTSPQSRSSVGPRRSRRLQRQRSKVREIQRATPPPPPVPRTTTKKGRKITNAIKKEIIWLKLRQPDESGDNFKDTFARLLTLHLKKRFPKILCKDVHRWTKTHKWIMKLSALPGNIRGSINLRDKVEEEQEDNKEATRDPIVMAHWPRVMLTRFKSEDIKNLVPKQDNKEEKPNAVQDEAKVKLQGQALDPGDPLKSMQLLSLIELIPQMPSTSATPPFYPSTSSLEAERASTASNLSSEQVLDVTEGSKSGEQEMSQGSKSEEQVLEVPQGSKGSTFEEKEQEVPQGSHSKQELSQLSKGPKPEEQKVLSQGSTGSKLDLQEVPQGSTGPKLEEIIPQPNMANKAVVADIGSVESLKRPKTYGTQSEVKVKVVRDPDIQEVYVDFMFI